MIYHITTRQSWEAAQHCGAYRAASLETEGFIHCSFGRQVAHTARRYFAGQVGLVLLHIDETCLEAELRVEAGAGTQDLFPHLYGPLNLDAVVKVKELDPEDPKPLETQ